MTQVIYHYHCHTCHGEIIHVGTEEDDIPPHGLLCGDRCINDQKTVSHNLNDEDWSKGEPFRQSWIRIRETHERLDSSTIGDMKSK